MRNPTILDKSYFSGSASRRFETSKMMEKLMENRKIALALYDKTRQREFHDAVIGAMDGAAKLEADELRIALHGLYNGNSHITKSGIKDIALELLSENRDSSKAYFVKSEKEPEPEQSIPYESPESPSEEGELTGETPEPTTRKRTVFQRIFG